MAISPRAAVIVTLATFNTIDLADGNVYVLVTPHCGPVYYNILNLGPCTVYYRADADPSVGDPDSVTLPPFAADNLVLVPEGTVGLRVLTGPPCTADDTGPPASAISVRLVRG